MSKILVTNLQDTLIPYHENNCRLLNVTISQKEILESLKKQLEPFLRDGNKLAIVTNPENITLEELINIYLNQLIDTLKEYQEQISIYLSGIITNEEDIYTISNFKDYKITTVMEKSNVFNYINNEDSIYCLGKDKNDIGMLKKAIELHGISGLIYNELLDPKYINQNNFITLLANEKIHEMTESEAKIHHLSHVAKVQLEKRLWLNLIEPIKREIEDGLKDHRITYIDIIKEWHLRKQIDLYSTYLAPNILTLEEINYLVSRVNVYNSIHEFNTLVLRK